MSKTIKQLADELGISKQALQKRIAREPLHTSIQPYISTENNTKYIATEGETLIKAAYNKQDTNKKSIDNSQVHTDKSIDKSVSIDKYIALLESQNKTLTAQLDKKDKQLDAKDKLIAELNGRIKELTTAIQANAETMRSISTAVNGAQALHAADKQELTQQDKPIDIQTAPKQTSQEQTQSKPRTTQRREPTARKTPKKGIFTNLFNRKGR